MDFPRPRPLATGPEYCDKSALRRRATLHGYSKASQSEVKRALPVPRIRESNLFLKFRSEDPRFKRGSPAFGRDPEGSSKLLTLKKIMGI